VIVTEILLMNGIRSIIGTPVHALRGRNDFTSLGLAFAPDENRALLDGSGFEVVHFATNDARNGGRTAWLCRRERAG
jgi:hypothetical protein